MKKELPKYPSRTRFGEIVCEYHQPLRKSRKVVILCGGMPGYPGSAGKVLRVLAEHGYWAFALRYRGSWESGGLFLDKSPHEDVLAVVDGLEKGFKDAWTEEVRRIEKPQVSVIGSSFGGPAAILAARDERVKKAVALSPVIDWVNQEGTVEPLDFLARFMQEGFGEAYRADKSVWMKLASGTFYNPVRHVKSVNGKKLLIIHAKDDEVVPFVPAKEFADETGAYFVGLRRGGHLGFSSALKPYLWRRIAAFIQR